MIEQQAKIRKSFNYLIQALIILVTYGFIYRQVFVDRKLRDVADFFFRMIQQRQAWFLISLILFLMLVNWGIEAVKWQLLIAKIEKISLFRAFKAVMTGVSVSIFTPNRTGAIPGASLPAACTNGCAATRTKTGMLDIETKLAGAETTVEVEDGCPAGVETQRADDDHIPRRT